MKTTTLQLRLQPDEKEAFEKAANFSGLGVSAWVRERLRRAAVRELVEAGQQVPFLQSTIKRGSK